ncbi:MAG: GNAT family N-acetyltransferase [Burkholderiaceae bacterium]|nr:GNAT family N-acetyltransferase [Burkholderiaceae bacterium]
MADITIRRMEPTDAEGVAAVFRSRSAAYGTLQNPYPSVADWVKRLSANDPVNHYGFVARADGDIVGHAGLQRAHPNPRRAHAWHLGMAVADAWQGQGIGTRLMETLIDLADHWLGVLRIELTVYCDNVRAIALYERFGFVVEGRHPAYSLREGEFVDTFSMGRLNPRPPRLPPPPAT